MLRVAAEGPEVYYACDPLAIVGAAEIVFLKERAQSTARLRSRLCLHAAPDAVLHEMIIVHHHDAYVRPHRHLAKAETLATIEGWATVVIFNDDGSPSGAFDLTPASGGPARLCRIPPRTWHALIIRSEWFVFSETTTGPFDRAAVEFGRWSPDGADPVAVTGYLRALSETISDPHFQAKRIYA